MNRLISFATLAVALFGHVGSSVAGESFTGTWTIGDSPLILGSGSLARQ
jgi:hypothetical protein